MPPVQPVARELPPLLLDSVADGLVVPVDDVALCVCLGLRRGTKKCRGHHSRCGRNGHGGSTLFNSKVSAL